MSKGMIFLDSFGGPIAELKPKDRTKEKALAILRENQRVSTFDMSEKYRWLPGLIDSLVADGTIEEVPSQHPWHKYRLTDTGRV